MEDKQFERLITVFEKNNMAIQKTFVESIKEVVKALNSTHNDHDLLIEIRTIIAQKVAEIDNHIDSSGPVRDDVRRNNKVIEQIEQDKILEQHRKNHDLCNFLRKYFWGIYVAVQGAIATLVIWLIRR